MTFLNTNQKTLALFEIFTSSFLILFNLNNIFLYSEKFFGWILKPKSEKLVSPQIIAGIEYAGYCYPADPCEVITISI